MTAAKIWCVVKTKRVFHVSHNLINVRQVIAAVVSIALGRDSVMFAPLLIQLVPRMVKSVQMNILLRAVKTS